MSNKLYKGIFWFKDFDDISQNSMYYRLHCDDKGNIMDRGDYSDEVFGKSGTDLNHEKFWNALSSRVTDSKEFDYYPRGRVEIRNGKATIFITQDLVNYQNEVIEFIKDKYKLNATNGIIKIDVKFDGSSHYKSKLG